VNDLAASTAAVPSAPLEIPRRPSRLAAIPRSAAGAAVSLVSIALAVGCWWLLALIIDNPLLMPTPAATVEKLVDLATGSGTFDLWTNAWASLKRVLIGWAAAVVVGILIGAAMASSRIVDRLIDPLVEFARPIPPLAYAPLFIVWFGIGEIPKLLVIFVGCLPTMIITTAAAVRGVDLSWLRAARTLGASRLYLFRKVILPASLPEVITGMRIASGFAWGVLVAAEILASTSGLGWMIIQAGRFLDTATIFVGIVTIGALAFLMDRALRVAERRFAPWKALAMS